VEQSKPRIYFPSGEELRPQTIEDFCGNEAAVNQIRRELEAAQYRGSPRNIILYGSAGGGKTTLSCIIANSLGYVTKSIAGSSIRNQRQFLAFVLELLFEDCRGNKTLVFIDEIHVLANMTRFNQEDLFLLLERGKVFCPSWVGEVFEVDGKEYRLDEPELVFNKTPVFVGATTDPGLLNDAMRRRFPCQVAIAPYRIEDMVAMLNRYERITGHKLTDQAKLQLAETSRLNPATLLSRLDSCLNRGVLEQRGRYARVTLDASIVSAELSSLGIQPDGAGWADLAVLERLRDSPRTTRGIAMGMGLAAMAGATGFSRNEIANMIEPFLKSKTWIEITNRRRITPSGLERLKAKLEWRAE
jgi:Holliday junction resolvasome RuvABC ATP-dependent DNA helicase subunit